MSIDIAPGARIVCRDAEWLVKSISCSSDGDHVIEALGVSEFLRGRRVQFLKEIEEKTGDLQVLKAEETALVNDNSSGYVHSLSQSQKTVPEDGLIYLGHRTAMDAPVIGGIPSGFLEKEKKLIAAAKRVCELSQSQIQLL